MEVLARRRATEIPGLRHVHRSDHERLVEVPRDIGAAAPPDALALDRDVAAGDVLRRALHAELLLERQVEEVARDGVDLGDKALRDAVAGDDEEAGLAAGEVDLLGDPVLAGGLAGEIGRDIDDAYFGGARRFGHAESSILPPAKQTSCHRRARPNPTTAPKACLIPHRPADRFGCPGSLVRPCSSAARGVRLPRRLPSARAGRKRPGRTCRPRSSPPSRRPMSNRDRRHSHSSACGRRRRGTA